MPAYAAGSSLYSIAPGDSIQVWNAEQPAPGNNGASASQAVALVTAQGLQNGINFTGFFSGAPGAFEIDVQGSENDVDAQYSLLPNGLINSVDAVTGTTFVFEDPNCSKKFVRALMKTRTNAVNVTADFKR